MSGKVAAAGIDGRGGDSLSEEKDIHRQIAGCNVTITFKGYNPDIKKKILDMLCDSFEERVMNGKSQKEDTKESE